MIYIWKGMQFQVKQYMKKVGFWNFSGKALPQKFWKWPRAPHNNTKLVFSHSVKTDLMKYRCSCNNLVHFNNLCAKSRQFPFSRQIIMSMSLHWRETKIHIMYQCDLQSHGYFHVLYIILYNFGYSVGCYLQQCLKSAEITTF